MFKTALVVGDVHAGPGRSTHHLLKAGHLLLERRPDYLIAIGDFADMSSLSSYDKGTARAEGKRVQEDIQAAKDAMNTLLYPVLSYNQRRREQKKRTYSPVFVNLGGNHEERINRFMNNNPEFQGMYSQDITQSAERYGATFVPFGEHITVEGVVLSHYFRKPGSRLGYSGKYIAQNLANALKESCIQGHTHTWFYHREKTLIGRNICTLSAGCFFTHDEHYAGADNKTTWWRGVTMLHGLHDGYFEVEQIGMDRLQ